MYISHQQQWQVDSNTQYKHKIDYNMCFSICDVEIDGFERFFILPDQKWGIFQISNRDNESKAPTKHPAKFRKASYKFLTAWIHTCGNFTITKWSIFAMKSFVVSILKLGFLQKRCLRNAASSINYEQRSITRLSTTFKQLRYIWRCKFTIYY